MKTCGGVPIALCTLCTQCVTPLFGSGSEAGWESMSKKYLEQLSPRTTVLSLKTLRGSLGLVA